MSSLSVPKIRNPFQLVRFFSKTEKTIFYLCLLGVLLCGLLLGFGDDRIFSDVQLVQTGKSVGRVVRKEKDTRRRSKENFVWLKVGENDDIYAGDSIFAGKKSKATVQFDDGGTLEVGENSMVVFQKSGEQKVPSLIGGNFTLNVNGAMKININGQETKIEGSKSQINVSIEKGKGTKLQLMSGEAKIKGNQGKGVALKKNVVAEIRALKPSVASNKSEKPSKENKNQPDPSESLLEDLVVNENPQVPDPVLALAPNEAAPPKPVDPQQITDPKHRLATPPVPENSTDIAANTLLYNWKLSDIYDQQNLLLMERTTPIDSLSLAYEIKWKPESMEKPVIEQMAIEKKTDLATLSPKGTVYIELSSDKSSPQHFETNESSFILKNVHVGGNYWRLSRDKSHWSAVQKFQVTASYLPDAPPEVSSSANTVPLMSESTEVAVHLKSNFETTGYVVQTATNISFMAENTKLSWIDTSDPKISFFRPGSYAYRYRAVNKQMQLSEWSKPLVFEVIVPALPEPPILSQNPKKKIQLGEDVHLAWNSKGVRTRIEIRDSRNHGKFDFNGTYLSWKPKSAGTYLARAFAQDNYHRWSQASEVVQFEVAHPIPTTTPLAPTPPKETPEQQSLAEKSKNLRSPSTEAKAKAEPLTEKLGQNPPIASNQNPPPDNTKKNTEANLSTRLEVPKKSSEMNNRYNENIVSLDGFMWALQSSEQFRQGAATPIATGAGIHLQKWYGNNGIESYAKTGVLGLNAAGKETSLKQVEGRLHRRFMTGFPFGLFRELQVSIFSGLEVYRNSGSYFLNQYDLLKFGTTLELPLASRWFTGGEFVYGLGGSSTSKREISGHLLRFMSFNWSFGIGYRIHLLDSGDPSKTPGGLLPYREGYTEGYSILNYHF